MFAFRHLIDFYFFGRHRLETVRMIPLGCSIGDAIKLYGNAIETKPSDESPEIIEHTFSAGPYHQAMVQEWKRRIHAITYWSVKSDPVRDLRCMLERYKDESQWQVMEEGYWFQREDAKVRLWCSAIPAIGVANVEFMAVKTAYKKARSLKQLDDLVDATWAPNDAVSELQRQFIEEQNGRLWDFAKRSDRIAVSPDGHHVFIVRNHHAYDVDDGFMELNKPPEPESGDATQVINCFEWSTAGSSWGKITLPRDANVEVIRFVGEDCLLQIRNTRTGEVLKFCGPAASNWYLRGISIGAGVHKDAALWQRLAERAESRLGENFPSE